MFSRPTTSRTRNAVLAILWATITMIFFAYRYQQMTSDTLDRTTFLPGQTTAGHHQIELACSACHTEEYGNRETMQEACESCHAEALELAKDDHPRSKFTDPRNADRIAVLDARYCVTCHVEHRPALTGDMGLTLPVDYCFLCHEGIGEDRPSHAGMAFDSCAAAGCHNFHDNRALYEDFLLKHLDEENVRPGGLRRMGNLLEVAEQLPDYPKKTFPIVPLRADDLAETFRGDADVVEEWAASSHAAAGVSCDACHAADAEDGRSEWIAAPGADACRPCHAGEVVGFLGGKHGMRLDVEKLGRALEPMRPGLARRAMKAEASERELSCTSCHGAHRFDARFAQVGACLDCHDDEHSLAYVGSAHHELWKAEVLGQAPAGSGVTCATCHMPRIEKDYFWGAFTHNEVQHNQSATLQPNEKMIRPVCLACHGLGFTIDSLADRELIDRNFLGQPTVHVESLELARRRDEALR